MANPQATGKKTKHGENLAQRSRAAVLNALDVVEKRGKLISEILADEFEVNPIRFMELASKLMPKDINENINSTVTILDKRIRAADGILGEFVATREAESIPGNGKDGSVFPAPVRSQ